MILLNFQTVQLLLFISLLNTAIGEVTFVRGGSLGQGVRHTLSGGIIKYGHFQYYVIANACQLSDINSNLLKDTVYGKLSEIGQVSFSNSTLSKIPTIIFTKMPNLVFFRAMNISLMQIYREDFRDAKNVTNLYLNNNIIRTLEDYTFMHLKKLQILDLSSNLITSINKETFGGTSETLFEVKLCDNMLTTLDYSALTPLAQGKKYPLELHLENNEIKDVKKSEGTSHLHFQLLSLNNNHLSAFSCPNIKINTFRLENNHLEAISMENCSIEYLQLTSNKLQHLHVRNDLKVLLLMRNPLKSIDFEEDSQLSHMEIIEVEDFSQIFPKLKTLKNMKHLALVNTLIGNLQEDSFTQMENLKRIALQSCGIQTLPHGIFAKNKNLFHIDLSENKLERFDLHMFKGLDKLNNVDISGNKISQIEGIEKIKILLPEMREIKIEGNPWKCLSLSTTIRTLNQLNIKISKITNVTTDVQNILGIPCY